MLLNGNVNDPNAYPQTEGVDWNNAANRLAYIQNSANDDIIKMLKDKSAEQHTEK